MRLGGLILGENIDKMPVNDDNKLLLSGFPSSVFAKEGFKYKS